MFIYSDKTQSANSDIYSNVEFEYTLGNAKISVYFKTFPVSDSVEDKPLHTHSYHEVVYVCADGACFEYAKGKEFLSEGDVILIVKGFSHVNNGLEQIKAYKLGIDVKKKESSGEDFYSEFCRLLEKSPFEIIKGNREFSRAFDNFEKQKNRDFALERIKLSIKEIIFILYDALKKNDGQTVETEGTLLSKNASEMIHMELIYHYTDITIDKVVEKVYLSERQINRICQKMYGRSFNRQRAYLRVERAKKLLATSTLDILDISMECGFSSLGSFYSAFEFFAHTTPRKYREKSTKIQNTDI